MEKIIGTPVKVIRFMDYGAIPWNKMTTVVRVRELRTNREFDIYEHQIRYDIKVIDLPKSSFEGTDFEDKNLSSAVMAYIN